MKSLEGNFLKYVNENVKSFQIVSIGTEYYQNLTMKLRNFFIAKNFTYRVLERSILLHLRAHGCSVHVAIFGMYAWIFLGEHSIYHLMI